MARYTFEHMTLATDDPLTQEAADLMWNTWDLGPDSDDPTIEESVASLAEYGREYYCLSLGHTELIALGAIIPPGARVEKGAPGEAVLDFLIVQEEYRGRRRGSYMLSLIEQAAVQDYNVISLTAQSVQDARGFFEHHNYAQVSGRHWDNLTKDLSDLRNELG